ncbi:hypothetical protein BH24ACI4_BH24ACI4_10180 [soil metagenome]
MKVRLAAACLAALLVLPGAARVQEVPDDVLAGAIAATLRNDRRLTIFDQVNGHVDGATVVLTGKVTSPEKRLEIQQRVATLAGVAGIRNHVTVLPTSRFDDDLRYRISRAIYGHPSFWTYAAMPHPPIHIIVENGHVTLTGIVNSRVERAMARSLASGYGEFSIVNELRTDQE